MKINLIQKWSVYPKRDYYPSRFIFEFRTTLDIMEQFNAFIRTL